MHRNAPISNRVLIVQAELISSFAHEIIPAPVIFNVMCHVNIIISIILDVYVVQNMFVCVTFIGVNRIGL